MRRIVEEAREAGRGVCLQVLKVNERACRFYERLGFAVVRETQTHVVMERAAERR